ncbi:response regulator transcription factor [Microlunatus soli]|uniref:Regulatory protein, luxR family n=1 Tax=Microlunatus soli TaxID=630515 RepID=A0A1H1R0R0_9ACTN|nr:helix-turn-helix transcriptional regulator [Microlunatus soli]SDS29273.1 regulatory protein, luxR family [Microlunatus soli]
MWAAERRPDPGAARRVRQAAEASDSRALQLVADYAVAISERDIATLTSTGDDLLDVGFAIVGLRAHVAALRLRRARGDVLAAARATDVLWQKSKALGVDLPVVSAALAHDIDLTPRELEIARLASSGRTNQSIAGHLSLSVRTVENHLLSSYRKIGVENRDALGRVMTTWLSSAELGSLELL